LSLAASGLNAEGFGAANGWTINFAALSGAITMQTYRPWVEN